MCLANLTSVGRAAESPESVNAQRQRVAQVAATPGLVAFWNFSLDGKGKWTSRHDATVIDRTFAVSLRRIGDARSYSPSDWPYTDEASRLVYDHSGPFGCAVRFNRGYIFAEVPRAEFDGTALDVHGRRPFTLVAWVKFVGRRHFVAGIWDEGGWNKYGGRRQAALFGGLFNSRGVIAHISSTGAASFPQSLADGSQYARCRAIDGASFENQQWITMAMTFDPAHDTVTALLNGQATPTEITDPVAQSVFHSPRPVASNPFRFEWPIFSPREFLLKFNGYDATTGVYEHRLHVDVARRTIGYGRTCVPGKAPLTDFRATIDVARAGKSLLPHPVILTGQDGAQTTIPTGATLGPGDEIIASLLESHGNDWRRVGSEVHYTLREGAPFTFGRALGLGQEAIDHGTELFIDGVAVFNRVLGDEELRSLSFCPLAK